MDFYKLWHEQTFLTGIKRWIIILQIEERKKEIDELEIINSIAYSPTFK